MRSIEAENVSIFSTDDQAPYDWVMAQALKEDLEAHGKQFIDYLISTKEFANDWVEQSWAGNVNLKTFFGNLFAYKMVKCPDMYKGIYRPPTLVVGVPVNMELLLYQLEISYQRKVNPRSFVTVDYVKLIRFRPFPPTRKKP